MQNIKIKRKLLLYSWIASSLSIILVCIVFMIYDIQSMKMTIRKNLVLNADTVAASCGSSLFFNDKSFAKQFLKGLEANPHIMRAAIYDVNDTLFAEHTQEIDSTVLQKFLEIQRPVKFNKQKVGYIVIRSDLDLLNQRVYKAIMIGFIVFLVSIGLSMLLSARLNLSVSKPVEELVAKSRIISDKKDYSIRAKKFKNDELGKLTDSFNEMLAEIQSRDSALKLAMQDQKSTEYQLRRAQKMEAIGTLAGGIAHDFNNILAAVIGYTEIVYDDLTVGSPEHNALKEVLHAGERAKSLVNQILTFSRTQEKEHKPIHIRPVIQEALNLIMASLPSTIRIHTELESDDYVMGDPTQIHQVIMNLCTNAGHAMQDHGGTLFVSLKNRELDSDFSLAHPEIQAGNHIEIAVSDTGHGMPEETQEKIFDPFFTTKKHGEGTGLGLSVVHGIVSNCHGMINVYSEPGKGTTFKVYLPAFRPRKTRSFQVERFIPGGTEHIFIVDDEPALANVMHQQLEKLGYSVTHSTNSQKAFELFKTAPDQFDLIITDMTMPGLTGDRLARKILDIRPDLPVIMCTGFSATLSRETALSLGIKEYIMKPVIKTELARIVRKVLDTQKLT